jgi:hypothetical protein
MSFRFYTSVLGRASRRVAAGIFIVGLLLIGFGVIIWALPEVFAFLAGAVFFLVGIGCGVIAIKIFWTQRQLDRMSFDDSERYRRNVKIHIEDDHDV